MFYHWRCGRRLTLCITCGRRRFDSPCIECQLEGAENRPLDNESARFSAVVPTPAREDELAALVYSVYHSPMIPHYLTRKNR